MAKRGVNKGSTVNIVNGGPYSPSELGRMFESFGLDKLRRCWVAVTIDCIGDLVPEAEGHFARALVTIASRLNGVEFEEPAVVEYPVTIRKRAVMADIDADQIEHAQVMEGTRPIPASRSRAPRPEMQKILALKPGQFLVIKKDVVSKASVVQWVNKAKKCGGHEHLGTYTIQGGHVCVYVPSEEELAMMNGSDGE